MLTKIPEDYAVFLDLDGTLIDIAPTPADVVVPVGLRDLFHGLNEQYRGALAILSGRKLADIDAITGEKLAAGAEHGLVLRDSDGILHEAAGPIPQLDMWRATLEAAARGMPGVVIEPKRFTVVAHYRLAPEQGPLLRELIGTMIADTPGTELLAAHMAWEIRPRGAGKGRALHWFMTQPHFAGRKPFFVGDDTTDEEAIEAANLLGGTGLHVARDFDGSTAAVRAFLARSLTGRKTGPGTG